MNGRREYKNISEETFCKIAEKNGWTPFKRGWPDFICLDAQGKVIVVEVKDTHSHPLKKEQETVMKILSDYGIPSYRWDLQTKKLEPFKSYLKRKWDRLR